jgi:rod shape-determining protein MreD
MMQNRMAVLRWLGYSVLLLLAIVLQTMVFPRIDAVPNPRLAIAAVVCIAVFSGVTGGAAAGFAGGMLCDALLGTEAYFSLSMMAAGAVTGYLCGRVFQRAFWPAVFMSAASVVVIESAFLLFYQVAVRGIPLSAFISVGLPAVIASIVCTPPVYPLFRAVSKLGD